jgi:branched-chain amino acid transport system permease protein
VTLSLRRPRPAAGTARARRRPDRLRLVGWLLGTVVAVVTLLLPLVLSRSQLTVYVLTGTSAMVTIGVSLLMGYAGQVSLGQAAFYAIGGYTAGLLAVHGWPSLVGLIAAPIVSGLIAALVGMPILRLRGHYLAFATLAFQLILLAVIGQISFFGGDIGLQGIPQLSLGGFDLQTGQSYAWLTWVTTALVLIVTRNIIASRPGRGLRALATSETAAESSGVPVTRYKVTVFALSAAFAGLAGGVYAYFLGYLAPGSFPVLLSFQFIVMAVVGGLGTLWGPVVGAVAIQLLVQWLTDLGSRPGLPSYAPSVFSYAVYAVLLVVVLLFLPRGLLPTLTDGVRRTFRGGHGGGGPIETAVTVEPVPPRGESSV